MSDTADVNPVVASSIGTRMKTYRDEAGMSLSQLAELSGVSKSYLWNLENRREDKRPSAKILFSIAKALGVTIADLLGHELHVTVADNIEPSLAEFAERAGLPAADVAMLASIRFRGDAPKSIDRWKFIYQAIRTSRELDP